MGQGKRVLAGLLTAAAVMVPTGAWAFIMPTVWLPRDHGYTSTQGIRVPVQFRCDPSAGNAHIYLYVRQRTPAGRYAKLYGDRGAYGDKPIICNGGKQKYSVWAHHRTTRATINRRRAVQAKAVLPTDIEGGSNSRDALAETRWKKITLRRDSR